MRWTSPPTSARVGVRVSGALLPITGVRLFSATWNLTRVVSARPSFVVLNSAAQSPGAVKVTSAAYTPFVPWIVQMNLASTVADGVVALLARSKKATRAGTSGDPMELFWASASANRKRLGPTASWTSMRIGMRVGPLEGPADATAEDPEDVPIDPQPATTAARPRIRRTSDPLPDAGGRNGRDDVPARRGRRHRPIVRVRRGLSHLARLLPWPVPARAGFQRQRLDRVDAPDRGRRDRAPGAERGRARADRPSGPAVHPMAQPGHGGDRPVPGLVGPRDRPAGQLRPIGDRPPRDGHDPARRPYLRARAELLPGPHRGAREQPAVHARRRPGGSHDLRAPALRIQRDGARRGAHLPGLAAHGRLLLPASDRGDLRPRAPSQI